LSLDAAAVRLGGTFVRARARRPRQRRLAAPWPRVHRRHLRGRGAQRRPPASHHRTLSVGLFVRAAERARRHHSPRLRAGLVRLWPDVGARARPVSWYSASPVTTLITGATGFLGQGAIGQILEHDPRASLVALIRARDAAQLERRRLALVDGLPEVNRARVTAMRGDITEPQLGLSDSDYEALCERIDRVVHIAATTKFDHSIEDARHINVGGTVQAIELCRIAHRNGRSGRLDYVGTAFVAGNRSGLAYEDELDVGQGFRNTYERSK